MVQGGELDCVWLWESFRDDRDNAAWGGVPRRCRDHRVPQTPVKTDKQLYDVARNPRNMKTLAEDGTENAWESEKMTTGERAARAPAPRRQPARLGHQTPSCGYQDSKTRGEKVLGEKRTARWRCSTTWPTRGAERIGGRSTR